MWLDERVVRPTHSQSGTDLVAAGSTHTYAVCMNLTISAQAQLIKRARASARAQGLSLQELIRRYLESLAGTRSSQRVGAELLTLMRKHPGRSDGRRITRDDAYGGRV